jgi:hypothetical protein
MGKNGLNGKKGGSGSKSSNGGGSDTLTTSKTMTLQGSEAVLAHATLKNKLNLNLT